MEKAARDGSAPRTRLGWRRRLAILSTTFAFFGSSVGAEPPAASPKDARQLLQEGLFEEEASHDLGKAATAYSTLIAKVDAERALAATAIFRLGEVRFKQGKKEEAAALWQRLGAEFFTQTELVKLSRERLASLGLAPAPALPEAPTDEEAKELLRLRDMAKNSPDLLMNRNASLENQTPLEVAADHGWIKAAEFLLSQGAKLNEPNFYYTPLFLAATEGHKAMVDFLLDHGANINATDRYKPKNYEGQDGDSPLIAAIVNDRRAVVSRLLERGAAVNAGIDGRSPLYVACLKGDLELARTLLDKGADPNVVLKPSPAISTVPRPGQRLTGIGEPNERSLRRSALLAAAGWTSSGGNRAELLELLLQKGAKPGPLAEDEENEVEWAIRQKNIKALKLFLRLVPKFKDGRLLTLGVNTTDQDILALVIQQMEDVNGPCTGPRPLVSAINRNWPDGAMMLLQASVSPKVAEVNGLTPLHRLAQKQFERIGPGDPQARKVSGPGLLPRGETPGNRQWTFPTIGPANVEKSAGYYSKLPPTVTQGNPGATADSYSPVTIMNAEWGKLRPLFEALLAKNADINARTEHGTTAFMLLVQQNPWGTEAMDWFVAHGADPSLIVPAPPDQPPNDPLLYQIEPEMRPELARRFILPKLGRADGILIWGFQDWADLPYTWKRKDENEAPPGWSRAIGAEPHDERDGMVGRFNSFERGARYAVVNRKGADGKWKEVAVVKLTGKGGGLSTPEKATVEFSPETPLQWGDAIFFCTSNENFAREQK